MNDVEPGRDRPPPAPRRALSALTGRRSVLHTLTLGIAALVGVFALAALFAALQTRALARDTEELTGRIARARTAAFEIEINAEELASATRTFLATGDSAAATRATDARAEMLQFQRLLISTGVAATSARELTPATHRLAAETDSLIRLEHRQRGLLARVRVVLQRMDDLLDEHIQASAEASLSRRPAVYQAAEEMEINLVELGGGLWDYLAGHDPRLRADLAKDRQDFERFLARYRSLELTPQETGWGVAMAALYDEHRRLVDETLALEASLEAGKARFTALEAHVEARLDHEVQPQVEAYRLATAQRARLATRRAVSWAAAGLTLATLVGAVVALATLRAVVRPLRVLTDAAQRIGEGALDHRVGHLPAAEFDRLAVAFDRMAVELATARGELERARDAAEDASRRKSDFVSEVSHELRTPLTAIRAALGLLAATDAAALPPASARLVELAKRNSERLGRLIDDTLDLDRIEAGADELHPGQVAPSALVSAALDATRARAEERRVVLEEEIGDDTAVRADPPRLERVLINLISNAVKYAPPGSAVRVRTVAADGGCRFEVEDHGPGIPEAHQPRIFQRFARAGGSADPGGTGLGLALARAIVERHGGHIGFDSRPGLTRFWFTVPAEREIGL